MNVWEAIRTKRAVRQFTDEQLDDETVLTILKAGRRAQSSKNSQPWNFIAIHDRDTLAKLATTGKYLEPVARAALCVALVTEDRPADKSNWIAFDIGQCAAYMQLAAHELGVGSVIGTIHRPEEARPILGLPEGYRCDVVLSFGYPADHERRPLQGQGRRPLAELVHWETW